MAGTDFYVLMFYQFPQLRMEAYVRTTTHDLVATIEFFHQRSNSMPGDLLRQLTEQIMAAGNDPATRVIVLQSGGDRAFCAGASFDELLAIDNEAAGRAFFMGFANVINACRKAPKFVIGRVQGKAIGGGVGLAAATDLCYASQAADVKLSELTIGIGPFVIGPAVERKIGKAAFSEMAMLATEFRTAHWAKERGLFADVFDDITALNNAVITLAERLSSYSPDAMRALKQMFWEGTEHWDTLLAERAATSGKLVLSAATRAFLASQRQ